MTSHSAPDHVNHKTPPRVSSVRLQRIVKFVAAMGLVGAYVHIGCGTVDDEQTVQEQSALGAFGSWTPLPSIFFSQGSPALARVGSTTWTAFGRGSNNEIWTTRKVAGQWVAWSQLTNNGGPFTDRVAAVGFDVNSGPLFNRFALIARRADNLYYIRIQNQTGSVVLQDWTPIGTGIYSSAPAVAFVPQSSATGPKNTLVVVGRGLDNRLWESRNTLTVGNIYLQNSWSGPFAPFGDQTFDSDPTLTYACPPTSASESLDVAAKSNQMFLVSSFTGTAWTSFTTMTSGTFISGPALAAGCKEFSNEVTIYGMGMDNRIWLSTYVPGSPGSFAPIGSNLFFSGPTAAGWADTTNVAASSFGGGTGTNHFMNTATSP